MAKFDTVTGGRGYIIVGQSNLRPSIPLFWDHVYVGTQYEKQLAQ